VKVRQVEAPAVFYVHQKLVCNSSGYFRNISKSFASTAASMRAVTLLDEEAQTFRTYLHWLYTGNVDHIIAGGNGTIELSKAYVLGEKLIDPNFQNAVLDRIVQRTKGPEGRAPGPTAVSIIYDGTPEGSPARRLMVDFCSYCANGQWMNIERLSRHVPAEFMDDLVAALVAKRPVPAGPRPWDTYIASYHVDTVKTKTEPSD
jgi:hypothetical protein